MALGIVEHAVGGLTATLIESINDKQNRYAFVLYGRKRCTKKLLDLHCNFFMWNVIVNGLSQGQAEVDRVPCKKLSESWNHAANIALRSQSGRT